MSRIPYWCEKYYDRTKELNHISIIAEVLGIEPNPDLNEVSLLSKTKLKKQTSKPNSDINESKYDRVTKNIERTQKRYESLIRQLDEQAQKQKN